MTRFTLGAPALMLALVGLTPAADPAPPRAAVPTELALLGGNKPARVELVAEVDGVPVSAIWDDTFARIFAYFDRDGNGTLDPKEAALLPSARALRQAMGNGFTPPSGAAPTFAELDRDRDGKVTPAELAGYYRAHNTGDVRIGVGRLPAGAELSAALLKALDTDGDSKVSEAEWKAAPGVLRKLDKNDDELVGAGELVPGVVYPGTAGTVLLTPPSPTVPQPVVCSGLPLVLLPSASDDTHWATEIARRDPAHNTKELVAWRKQAPAAKWVVKLSRQSGSAERFVFATGTLRTEGWVANGNVEELCSSVRKQLVSQLGDAPAPTEPNGARRAGGGLAWLVPIADRNNDGKLDRKELDAWLDLQAQIARGQVLITVLDGAGTFELIDTNHDGALSVRELRTAWDRLKEAGCVSDGAYDPAKRPRVLLVAASHGYPSTISIDVRRGPDWFRAMDRNGDGDVSRREFTGPADLFDKLDLDRDGLLSASEAEKAQFKR